MDRVNIFNGNIRGNKKKGEREYTFISRINSG